MKPLFETIRDQLVGVEGLEASYWDLNQLDEIENGTGSMYTYPCALIRLSVNEWEDLSDNAQQGVVEARISLVGFEIGHQEHDAPAELLELRDAAHEALQGLKMSDTEHYQASPLVRVSEEPTDETTNLPVWIMTYECELLDLSACPDKKVAMIKQLNIGAAPHNPTLR